MCVSETASAEKYVADAATSDKPAAGADTEEENPAISWASPAEHIPTYGVG